jgi:hypothetical protein
MDLGLAALAADDTTVIGAVGAAAVGALALGAVQVMYHGTHAGRFKRFLRDRPTFFAWRPKDIMTFALAEGVPGNFGDTPCQSPPAPAVLKVAVDPGRILDQREPGAAQVVRDVLAEYNKTAHPRRLDDFWEDSAQFASGDCDYCVPHAGSRIPALPYSFMARREIVDALAARGYDSAMVAEITEGEPSFASLAVFNARDRARVLRRFGLSDAVDTGQSSISGDAPVFSRFYRYSDYE